MARGPGDPRPGRPAARETRGPGDPRPGRGSHMTKGKGEDSARDYPSRAVFRFAREKGL